MDTNTFKDNKGTVITKEQMQQWEKEFEAGDYSKWKPVGKVRYGQPHATNAEDNATISFVAPVSVKKNLDEQAKKRNCSASDLLRAFTFEGLAHMS